MKRKKTIQHSKADVLKLDEIEAIIKWMNTVSTRNRSYMQFLFVCLTYGGYRISELLHQQKDWLHIDDEYAKSIGMNYVQIPEKGQFCSCRDCKLQVFLEQEAAKEGAAQNDKWYRETIKRFDASVVPGRYWEPKTEDGARKIPVLYDTFKDQLQKFYTTTPRLNYTRQWAWKQVVSISLGVWGGHDEINPTTGEQKKAQIPNRLLYPHALRATAASLWAMKGINATALKEIMGWKSIAIADMYVMSDEKQALLTCERLVRESTKKEREDAPHGAIA